MKLEKERERREEKRRERDSNLQNGDFFLDRPNQFRRGGSKEAPEVESDLEEGRCFHMGKVEKGENEVMKKERKRKEREREREKRSEAGRRFFWEVGDEDGR